MTRNLQCYVFGHHHCRSETDVCCVCDHCVAYEEYIDGHMLPIWKRVLPDYMRYRFFGGLIGELKRRHKKCYDCGTRNLIRKCGHDCIPF